MPLTKEQEFKVGFLLKCAEEGLTIEETHERVKRAIAVLKARKGQTKEAIAGLGIGAGKVLGEGIEFGGRALGALPGLLGTGALLGVGLPVAGGAGLGYLAAKLTGGEQDTIDTAKSEEIINEYERLADEAKKRAKLKRLHELTGKRVVALTPSI